MTDEIPDWAVERVRQEMDREYGVGRWEIANGNYSAFARYIASHEEPPVDPLLVEARKAAVAASYGGDQNWATDWRDRTLSGQHDGEDRVQVALAALKRGIEIGKSDA